MEDKYKTIVECAEKVAECLEREHVPFLGIIYSKETNIVNFITSHRVIAELESETLFYTTGETEKPSSLNVSFEYPYGVHVILDEVKKSKEGTHEAKS